MIRLGSNDSRKIAIVGPFGTVTEVLPRSGDTEPVFPARHRPALPHNGTAPASRRSPSLRFADANSGHRATHNDSRRCETGYPESWAERKLAYREKDRHAANRTVTRQMLWCCLTTATTSTVCVGDERIHDLSTSFPAVGAVSLPS